MNPEDDRLLEQLRRALEPEPAEPPVERRLAVRAAAIAGRGLLAGAGRRRRRRRILSALAAAAVVAAFAGGLVTGHEMPRPLREAADFLGLPIESPELVDARGELFRLGVALSQGDAEEALDADREMLRLIGLLDEEEKGEIVPVAHEVHCRAVDFLGLDPEEEGCV